MVPIFAWKRQLEAVSRSSIVLLVILLAITPPISILETYNILTYHHIPATPLPLYTISDTPTSRLPARARSTPKTYEDTVEEANARAATSRAVRGGRGGRTKGGKKKAQKDDILLDPALQDRVPQTQYLEPTATDLPKPYYDTPERESPAQERGQSVAM